MSTVSELMAQLSTINDQIRELVVDQLKIGEVQITFTKKDGTTRNMKCSLRADLIPTTKVKESVPSIKKENKETIRVFDTEKKAWRSFRLNSIDYISVV